MFVKASNSNEIIIILTKIKQSEQMETWEWEKKNSWQINSQSLRVYD